MEKCNAEELIVGDIIFYGVEFYKLVDLNLDSVNVAEMTLMGPNGKETWFENYDTVYEVVANE